MDGSSTLDVLILMSLLLQHNTLILAKSLSVVWDWSQIRWFTCSEPNDKGLILTLALDREVSIDLTASSQGHHGKISMWSMRRLPTSQRTHFDAHVNHLQIHTVHTLAPLHRWCEHVRVKACRSAAPQTFVALTQHHRRRQSEGPYCHPHPVLSAYHTLHMWKDLPPNHHHIRQHTQASQPSRWPYLSKQNVADAPFPPSFTRVSKH